ncbi:MAG: hypothetical protein PVF54_07795, partial [Anaerolineae bacterium]
MKLGLPARPPFALPAVATSHGWIDLAPFEWEPASGVLRRVERLTTGRVVALNVTQSPDGVLVQTASALSDVESREVANKVRWMLRLGDDLSAFYALIGDEPRLAQVEPR